MKERIMRNKNPALIGAAVVAFFVLGCFAAAEYAPEGSKIFGFENYYEGVVGEGADPKEVYSAIYKNTAVMSSKCKTVMMEAEHPTRVGVYTWIADGITVSGIEDLEALAIDPEDLSALKPFTGAQNIVAPAELKFVNANTVQYAADTISIHANIGTEYRIVFDNVASWWCHMGKADPTKHTDVIGSGGIFSRCAAGYVIGQANSDTVVSLYKVEDGGASLVPVSFADVFLSGS